MSKLIKKFQTPAGPLEYYSGILPEVLVQAPLTHIGTKTPGVYLVETNLKRKDGRGRVYRGHRDGKDIYYLTSKKDGKIIGYTYDVPKEGENWSWDGYQAYLDKWTAPEALLVLPGLFDRTHTERVHGIKTLDRNNPMYRGLTLNGNTDLSYAGTLYNNLKLAELGAAEQAALQAVASAMFMGGPSAVDNIFDISDALNNAATGNWGMAGLSLGSALLPGISYGASRIRPRTTVASPNISVQQVTTPEVVATPSTRMVTESDVVREVGPVGATSILDPNLTLNEESLLNLRRYLAETNFIDDTTPGRVRYSDDPFENEILRDIVEDGQITEFDWSAYPDPDPDPLPEALSISLEGLPPMALFRIGRWLDHYSDQNVSNFTSRLSSSDIEDTMRHFGLAPTDDFTTNLNVLNSYLNNVGASRLQAAPLPRSIYISGREHLVQGLSNSDMDILANLPDDGVLSSLDRLSDLNAVMDLFGLPDLGDRGANLRLLREYLAPTNRSSFHNVNSSNPQISQAFLRLGFLPINPELYLFLSDNAVGLVEWDPAYNQVALEAILNGSIPPYYTPEIRNIANNARYGIPVEYLHLNTLNPYDGSYPFAHFTGENAATADLAKQYLILPPDDNRAAAIASNREARIKGNTEARVPVNLFTAEELLNGDVTHLLKRANSYEPNFTMSGVGGITSSDGITPLNVALFLGNNNPVRRSLFGKQSAAELDRALARSGNVIGHASLSVDSYPLKMERIGRAMKVKGNNINADEIGDVIRYPYLRTNGVIIDGVPYKEVNDYGIRNRIAPSPELEANAYSLVLDPDGRPVQEIISHKFYENTGEWIPIYGNKYTNNLTNASAREEIIDGVRRIHYTSQDGKYLGYADVLSDQQTVDLLNALIQDAFPEGLKPAPVILKDGVIMFPDERYIVKRNGGKLIPKCKKGNKLWVRN